MGDGGTGRGGYKEHDGHVQRERDTGVQREHWQADFSHDIVYPAYLARLEHQKECAINQRAHRREVVQRHERIHLVLVCGEQALHHDEACGLEADPEDLVDHAGRVEGDLAP